MSSTPCASEALDRLIAPWAAKIAKFAATTVRAIVANAENVRAAVEALKPHGPKARRLLAAKSGLSRPMLSKLETIGRHAGLLRQKADTLPPSVSSLYALARMPSAALERAVMMDLRNKSRAEIEALFARPVAAKPIRKLMTIAMIDDLEEPARRALIADIRAALERIAQNHGTTLDIVTSASGMKSADKPCGEAQDTAKQLEPPRRRSEPPGFFTGENLIEGHDVTAHRQRSLAPVCGVLPPQVKKPGRGELPSFAVLSREREEIRQRIARLENCIRQRRSLSGSEKAPLHYAT